MSGDPVLPEILERGQGFGHRQHVELAWRHLEDHELLGSDAARAGVVEPDIRPLPVLVA